MTQNDTIIKSDLSLTFLPCTFLFKAPLTEKEKVHSDPLRVAFDDPWFTVYAHTHHTNTHTFTFSYLRTQLFMMKNHKVEFHWLHIWEPLHLEMEETCSVGEAGPVTPPLSLLRCHSHDKSLFICQGVSLSFDVVVEVKTPAEFLTIGCI